MVAFGIVLGGVAAFVVTIAITILLGVCIFVVVRKAKVASDKRAKSRRDAAVKDIELSPRAPHSRVQHARNMSHVNVINDGEDVDYDPMQGVVHDSDLDSDKEDVHDVHEHVTATVHDDIIAEPEGKTTVVRDDHEDESEGEESDVTDDEEVNSDVERASDLLRTSIHEPLNFETALNEQGELTSY